MSEAQKHDDAIRTMLSCGDQPDIEEGFALIEKHFRDTVFGWLRSTRYPGMSPENFADVWQEALLELLEQVQAKKYDGSRRVLTDLCRLIKTNAIDQHRRHKAREALLQAFGFELRGTHTGQKWQSSNPPERREIQALVRDAAIPLKEQQRTVLEAYLANLPESYNMQMLKGFVSEMTGVEHTLASVKGSLREVRRKLRGVLRRKGYTFAGDDDE